jgi:hypothetical protein
VGVGCELWLIETRDLGTHIRSHTGKPHFTPAPVNSFIHKFVAKFVNSGRINEFYSTGRTHSERTNVSKRVCGVLVVCIEGINKSE